MDGYIFKVFSVPINEMRRGHYYLLVILLSPYWAGQSIYLTQESLTGIIRKKIECGVIYSRDFFEVHN